MTFFSILSLFALLSLSFTSSAPSLLGMKEGSSFEGSYFQTNSGHPEGITRVIGKGISYELDKLYIKAVGGTVGFTPESIDMTVSSNSWQMKPLQDSFYFNHNKKMALEVSSIKDSKDSFSLFVAGDFHMNLSYYKGSVLQFCSLTSSVLDKKCTEKNVLDLNSVYKVSLSRLINLLYENFSSFLSLYDEKHKALVENLQAITNKIADTDNSEEVKEIGQRLSALSASLDKLSLTVDSNHKTTQDSVTALNSSLSSLSTLSSQTSESLSQFQANFTQFLDQFQPALSSLHTEILQNVTSYIQGEVQPTLDQLIKENISEDLTKLQASSSELELKLSSFLDEDKENKQEISTQITQLDSIFQANLTELTDLTSKKITNLRESLFISLELQSDAFTSQVDDFQQLLRKDLEGNAKEVDGKIEGLKESLFTDLQAQLSSMNSSLSQSQAEAKQAGESSLQELNDSLSKDIKNITENLIGKLNEEIEQTKSLVTTNLQSKLKELDAKTATEAEKNNARLSALEGSLKKEEKDRESQIQKFRTDFDNSIKDFSDFKHNTGEKLKQNEKLIADEASKLSSRLDSLAKLEETNRAKTKEEIERNTKVLIESSSSILKKETEALRSDIKRSSDRLVEQTNSFNNGLKDEITKREKLESSTRESTTQINSKLKEHDTSLSKLDQTLSRLKDDHEKHVKSYVESSSSTQLKLKEVENNISNKVRDMEISISKETEKLSQSLNKDLEKSSAALNKELDKLSTSITKDTTKLTSDLSIESEKVASLSSLLKSEEKDRLSFDAKLREDLDKHVEASREQSNSLNLKLKDFDHLSDKLKLFNDKSNENFSRVEALVKNEEKERLLLSEKLSSLSSKNYEKLEESYSQLLLDNQLLKSSNQQLEARLDRLSQEVAEMRSLLLSQVSSLVSAVLKTNDKPQQP